jgi:hypothetical protein
MQNKISFHGFGQERSSTQHHHLSDIRHSKATVADSCLVTIKLSFVRLCSVCGRYRYRRTATVMSETATMTAENTPAASAASPPEPYYFEGGLRRVKPYYHTYNTHCKERWRGRTLLDIFTSEFRDRTPEYYVRVQLQVDPSMR